eukprot:10302413-Prorocentrum_lima.AAC.1
MPASGIGGVIDLCIIATKGDIPSCSLIGAEAGGSASRPFCSACTQLSSPNVEVVSFGVVTWS